MDEHLHFHSLFRGQTVAVTDVCCRPGGGECGPEEYSAFTTIVLPRAGAFVRHVGRQRVVANSNHVLFFRAGETYRVSHPVAGGDDCTSLAFDQTVLADTAARYDPAARDRPESSVAFTHGPSSAELGLFVHQFRRLLRAGGGESLVVEELAMALLDAVLDGAHRARGERPVVKDRAATRAQRERVEAAKGYVTGQFRSRLTLGEIARAVHYSPYHLARLFRRESGEPIHRYLNRLRLGAALERLADGADDLTALGLDLGFSSHSHFSSTFRREFGISPSAFRSALTSARLRELSKNLKAGPPATRVG
jgi:AraC family transcriptional regulator